MLLQRLFENLEVAVEPFATCEVAPGWRLRLPSFEWVTLHYVLKGEGTLTDHGGAVVELRRGTLVVVPAGAPHSIESGQVHREAGPGDSRSAAVVPQIFAGPREEVDFTVACGRIRVTYGGDLPLFSHLHDNIVLDFSDSPQMAAVFEGLLAERASQEEASRVMMSTLMNQCLLLVFRRLAAHAQGRMPWLAALDDPALSRVLDEILREPEQPHTLESLASRANMSRSVFAKRFHESFGHTPMRYVRDVRLRRAAQLLRRQRDLSVAAVAHRVGFDSRSQFSQAFHRLFGASPSDFRTQAAAP